MFSECAETVSILYAIVFGAGNACVRISMPSVLLALVAFFVAVFIVQFIARKVWARVTAPRVAPQMPEIDRPVHGSIVDDPNYAKSAIRSNKR